METRLRVGNIVTHEADEFPDIEVGMNEWEEAQAPVMIGTEGLGPCTGIIIYDPKGKHAFVGHFPFTYGEGINSMFQAIEEKYDNKSGLRIFLGGQNPISDHPLEAPFDPKDREDLLKQLKDLGLKNNQIHAEWLKPGENTIMTIDTSTGRVNYATLKDAALRRPSLTARYSE